ncbi:ABC transporter permease [Nocardioides sp. KIGAM211]|uniref:ABC transporter permease n=1 Tax=Nocardioides luti TaxID=2761101 RepID=A0A7X0REJ4_9ACTN|nr:ABC transporter permease [Nocardioides luti]MBB6626792.1 ABC transporter permease [Nocardioides luti]
MSTTMPAAPALTLDVSGTRPIPFGRLVGVELRKSYDTRAGLWLLLTIGGLTLLVEGVVLAVTTVQDEPMSFGDFIGAAAFMTSIVLPVLGIMVVTSEWGQRTAMVTFALEPRRPRVILAKLVTGLVLTLATAVFAIVVGLVCILLYAALQGESPTWDFGWNYLVGFLVTQSFAMIGGFALATLLLNTPAAIVVFFVYKWVLPGLFALGTALISWFGDLAPWLDFQAAQGPVYDLTVDGSEWSHLVVSGLIWLVLPLALGVRRVLRAEVK